MAAASAASAGVGNDDNLSRCCTIFCTCSFPAPPHPATASLTWLGVFYRSKCERCFGQGETAGLANTHCGAHVVLEEHLLDSDNIGFKLGD